MAYEVTEKKEKFITPDVVNTAVDSSHTLDELLVNIITPIVSGVVISLVSSFFKKK